MSQCEQCQPAQCPELLLCRERPTGRCLFLARTLRQLMALAEHLWDQPEYEFERSLKARSHEDEDRDARTGSLHSASAARERTAAPTE